MVLPNANTRDWMVLEISKTLMPLYQRLGKYHETNEGIMSCAADIAILHIPTGYSVIGIDEFSCPDWNVKEFSNISDMFSICSQFLKPKGTLLCLCPALSVSLVSTYAMSCGLCEDHAIGVFTKDIHGIVDSIPVC